MKFNEYPWHDAVIKQIKIDRANPGINDSIEFEIQWPDTEEKSRLVFEGVYWAQLHLNFGIVADESIMDAIEMESDNEQLAGFYAKWKGLMNDVKLTTYQIDLNSTGSLITIIAKDFRVGKLFSNGRFAT